MPIRIYKIDDTIVYRTSSLLLAEELETLKESMKKASDKLKELHETEKHKSKKNDDSNDTLKTIK